MSLAILSPTLEAFKYEYHQDIARLYYDVRPLMHSVGLLDADFVAMVQNFCKIYARQKFRLQRYRNSGKNDVLDDDELVENVLLEEFVEKIPLPPISSSLPKELEILKANLQKDVLIVWNCLPLYPEIPDFDTKVGRLLEKIKQKYIRRREMVRKILFTSDYVAKNVCYTSSDPQFIVSNELHTYNWMKRLTTDRKINFSNKFGEKQDSGYILDSLETHLMTLKKQLLRAAKKTFFEGDENHLEKDTVMKQMNDLQEKYISQREALKQKYNKNYVPNRNYSKGSDIVLMSKNWMLKEQNWIIDDSAEQELVVLACKTLKDELNQTDFNPKSMEIVYELLHEAVKSTEAQFSILNQTQAISKNISLDLSLNQSNISNIIDLSLQEVQKLPVPVFNNETLTFEAKLDLLKQQHATALANCLEKHVKGTFQDVLQVLRKLNALQDLYVERRERLKLKNIEDYQDLSHDLDSKSSTINVLLQPKFRDIMRERYRINYKVEDYVNELIAEKGEKIMNFNPSISSTPLDTVEDQYFSLLLRSKKILRKFDIGTRNYFTDAQAKKCKKGSFKNKSFNPKFSYVTPRSKIPLSETPVRVVKPHRRNLALQMHSPYYRNRQRAGQTDDPEEVEPKIVSSVPARREFNYNELPAENIDDVEMPSEFMSEETGQLFLPDMINLTDDSNPQNDGLFNTSMPDIGLDISFDEILASENIERLLQKARKVQEQVHQRLSDETSFIPLMHEKEMSPQKKINLLDVDSPTKSDFRPPLQAVSAPLPQQKQFLDLDNSFNENLQSPLLPTYVPLKPMKMSTDSSTLGTSSSERFFRLNLPKDFIPTKVKPKAARKLVLHEESLFDTSMPDEDFFEDSDSEKRRQYYKLVDISSPESSFVNNLPRNFVSGEPTPYRAKTRFDGLEDRLTQDDLFDTEIPDWSETSISDETDLFDTRLPDFVDISDDTPQSPVRKPQTFTVLPFPVNRRRKPSYGRPTPATRPPEYLYTLHEVDESPYKSPKKPIFHKVRSPDVPIIIKRRRVPSDLQQIINKYSRDEEIESPLSSTEEFQRLGNLRKCLNKSEKNCVEEYKKYKRRLKEQHRAQVASFEDSVAQEIVDTIKGKKMSPKKRTAEREVQKLQKELNLKKGKSPPIDRNLLKQTATKSRQFMSQASSSHAKAPKTTPSHFKSTRTAELRAKLANKARVKPSSSLHKKAGLAETLVESPTEIKNELHKLFIEFSQKLKTKGLLPVESNNDTNDYYEQKTTKSFEKLLPKVGLKSSNDSLENLVQKIDLVSGGGD